MTDQQNTDWQPIDTAPKDGTPVDLWHKCGARMTETWWIAEDNCWSCLLGDDAFTHWQPITCPPQPVAEPVETNETEVDA